MWKWVEAVREILAVLRIGEAGIHVMSLAARRRGNYSAWLVRRKSESERKEEG